MATELAQGVRVCRTFFDRRRPHTANYVLLRDGQVIARVYQRGPTWFQLWRDGEAGVYPSLEDAVQRVYACGYQTH